MSVVTWSAYNPDQQPEAVEHHTTMRVGKQTTFMNGRTGEASSSGHTSSNMYHEASPGDPILTTARTSSGSPVGRLTPDSTIELEPGNPGSRTSLAVAEKMGYVRRTGPNTWEASPRPKGEAPGDTSGASSESANRYEELTKKSAGEAPSEEGTQEETGGVELFNDAEEGILADMISDLPQSSYDTAVVLAARSIATTGDITEAIPKIAQAAGIHPMHARDLLNNGFRLFTAQADKAIAKLGADPGEFFDWARENHPDKLTQAAVAHVSGRNLQGYRELAETYLRSTPPSLDVIKAKGLRAFHNDASGEDIVEISGNWWPVKAAVKMGLL